MLWVFVIQLTEYFILILLHGLAKLASDLPAVMAMIKSASNENAAAEEPCERISVTPVDDDDDDDGTLVVVHQVVVDVVQSLFVAVILSIYNTLSFLGSTNNSLNILWFWSL